MKSDSPSIILLFLYCITLVYFSEAVGVNNLTCSGSTLHSFRIKGCSEEPCKIRKGEPLPIELDLSFSNPANSSSVYFNVFIPRYAVPPAVHGSSLLTATCEQGNLGFDCPVKSDQMYTLKSQLFIDSQAVCTRNCEPMEGNGTVLKETKWRWAISDKRSRALEGKKSYSSCTFRVTLNITE